VLAPGALAVAAAVFGIAVAATRFVSFGSTLAAVALVVAVASLDASPSLLAGAVASAALVLGRHRGNLTRLLAGTERRVSFRAAH
jgi:glycerol-3-phosphate acyltransferase PlsY